MILTGKNSKIYKSSKLAIFVLSDGEYIESNISALFPSIPIIEGISRILDRRNEILMSAARKEFRQWVNANPIMTIRSIAK